MSMTPQQQLGLVSHKILRAGFLLLWILGSAVCFEQIMIDSTDQSADPTGWRFGTCCIATLAAMVIYAVLDKLKPSDK